MVVIKPFRAFHFNKSRFSNIETFIAPPYDIIRSEQELKLKKNQHNITHVDLPTSYEQAAATLNEWIQEKVHRFHPENKKS